MMDFVGGIRMQLHQIYPYPLPQEIIAFVTSGIKELEGRLSEEQRRKIAGMGVAAPFELWNWAEQVGAPQGAMDVWRGFDLRAEIASRVAYPVFMQNDATSACGAELVFGDRRRQTTSTSSSARSSAEGWC